MHSIGTTGLPAADHEDVRVLASIELSLKRWRVASVSPDVDKISRIDVAGGDAAGLLQRLERWGAECARRLGRPVGVTVCYEAGRDGFWLARYLEAHGIAVLVIDPASLQVNRRARRAKTDRIDVEGMLRALRRHCWGEPKVFSVVRQPSPAEEDSRCLSRERESLVKERTRQINTIKALLTAQGAADIGVGRRGWVERLAEARTGDGRALAQHLRARLARLIRRLDEVARQWMRHQPDSPLTKWFLARVGEARGRIRRIAVIAVARKLLIVLWRYVTTGLLPDGVRLSNV
jgi:transposase